MRTSKALAVMVIGVVLFVGCEKSEPKPVVHDSSPESYMNDPEFMGKVKAQEDAKRGIMKKVAALRREYDEAVKADPNGEKAAAVKKQLEALEDEFQANRRKTQAIVAERLRPKKKSDKTDSNK